MVAASILATYVGTRTLSSSGRPVEAYRTETHERAERTKAGRLVHDDTVYTLTIPPNDLLPSGPAFEDEFVSETAERTFEGAGPSDFASHVAWARRTRNYFGRGTIGYGMEHTFEASFRRDSIARVEHEATFEIALDPGAGAGGIRPDIRNDLTTTIADDGSFERVRKPMHLNGYRETQRSDDSYAYFSQVPGFSYVDYRYTPVVKDRKLTGIAFHLRTRGRTIGDVPFVMTDGTTTPAWLTASVSSNADAVSELPAAYETRTMTIGAPMLLPADCPGRKPLDIVVPSIDARHNINMGGRITDETTTSYYDDTTLVCRIADTHIVTYDVITNGVISDTNDRDVRVLHGA